MGSVNSLREQLKYEVVPLKFGTSGRRGKVVDLTQLEIYTNVTGEIEYLLSLESSKGGISKGDDFYFAYDLRPSSTELVENGRGGIAQAVVQAASDNGLTAINLGAIPTPAQSYTLRSKRYKLNTSRGELLKKDEAPINASVERVRERLLEQSANESLFDQQGRLRSGNTDLPKVLGDGRDAYIKRYLDFFPNQPLAGLKLLVYQHSAVGRDVVVEILSQLGAKCTPAGRSSTFVPIDTEAVDVEQLDTIQKLIDATGHSFDAVVSTDGDSDRPLLVAPDGNGNGNKGLRFFGGDLLGMIVAEYLGTDAVVVPISSNDAIDRGALASVLEPKTKIGSPYVIAGMETATKSGRRRVCGWEANGGFLTASDIERDGNVLKALPTRDAVLPLLCVLSAAKQRKLSVPELFATLPARYSRASLLRNFARSASLRILARFSQDQPLEDTKKELLSIFTKDQGFSEISRIDYTDGLRLIFENGDVAHVRPSGNADELRIYAVADTQARADEIVEMGIKQPDGLLRLLEKVSSE
ncbi:Phosphomannomutase [Cyphellophora attinorum]|uniref:Phosphomannomutase n=1 Tax=Cyphellophora attinorum TaxID=1664694 RepID=A0A0N1NWN6_9EURO|nr:Phosphomannomutase [Phialophora attinorum]KPI36852.1 Phosphomannomutase [Phialophora attinorum]